VNLYEIGFPACKKLRVPAGEDAAFVADDALSALARRFVARHPGAYARLVAYHFGRLLDPGFVLFEAIALGLGLVLYRRTRAPTALFAVTLALLPLAYMAPTCFFNYPSERYHSQVFFADYLALPFALVVLAKVRRPSGGALE
jgi:hypothetical protein